MRAPALRLPPWHVLMLTALSCGACSNEQGTGSAAAAPEGDSGEAQWIVAGPSGNCNSVLYAPPLSAGGHVAQCSELDHLSNPPTSGEHYPVWADYRRYDTPVARGFYVHSMEHGAVVLAYDCPGGCDDQVAAMQALVDELPDDPTCDPATRVRVIITPDPALDVPFAAIAWGHMLKAECFDAGLVQDFIDAHYAQAPEDLCGPGIDPTSACD